MAVKKVPEIVKTPHSFCPGCGHGIINRVIAEVIEEVGYEKKSVMTLAVGCSWNMNAHWGAEKLQTAHGRASACATGVKTVKPELLSLSYQGDGDAYVIGLAETLNAAYRGTNITVFVVNNNNFGMTGGQMSWTTIPGQKTTTSPNGRDPVATGYPIKIPEIIAKFPNVAYTARGSVHNAKEINNLKGYVKNAIEAQINGEGYSLVEILAPCPTNLGRNLEKSLQWMEENALTYYKLGEFKERQVK